VAKEKRLIDANALYEELATLSVMVTGLRAGKGILNEFMKQTRESVLRIVDEQPTVEAVEVVRCKDCLNAQKEEPLGTLWCNGTIVKGDYFCASGERRPYRGNG
jgi:hypothetical protein